MIQSNSSTQGHNPSSDEKPIRVLAISPQLPDSSSPGSNAPLLRQVESLRERGVHVDVIDMRGTPMIKYLLAVPRMWWRMRNVDLVHGHFGFCGWLARMQCFKPLVISFMGDDLLGEPNDKGGFSRFSRMMVVANKFLARLARQVIVKSPEMAGIISPTVSHVVPNGVDTTLFRPVDISVARERLGWKQDQVVILFPGNPDNPRKGYTLAVESTRVAESLLGQDIRIQPMWGVKPGDVPLLMNACNAVWMTSSIEGSPNVVKEAMSCDRPIVAVPVGDVEDLLDGVAGCHVGPRDPEKLGDLMASVLKFHDKSAGREALEQMNLDLGSVAFRVENIYRSVLGRPASARPETSNTTTQSTTLSAAAEDA